MAHVNETGRMIEESEVSRENFPVPNHTRSSQQKWSWKWYDNNDDMMMMIMIVVLTSLKFHGNTTSTAVSTTLHRRLSVSLAYSAACHHVLATTSSDNEI
jgi:hypothetical protein